MKFTDPAAYRYKRAPATVVLGQDNDSVIGFAPERHLLTLAGSGTGKGVAQLIPNALFWRGNLLVVDPKGETAAATWWQREQDGQEVRVIDPYGVANVPHRLRAAFNPLATIRATDPKGRADLRVIADGMVVRSNKDHEEWYEGAVKLLAGLMAYVLENGEDTAKTFAAVRAILLEPNEITDDEGNLVGGLYAHAQWMQECTAFGGLARQAARTLTTALQARDKSMEGDFLGAVRRYTEWLDDEALMACLDHSTFDLSELKHGNIAIYLVIPPKYLDDCAPFLRLFVRCGIEAMMEEEGGPHTLMLLDEFFSLGKLDVVSKSYGLMRSYHLHIWPFMQELGQLQHLYGDILSGTFMNNSDAVCIYGVKDSLTCEFASGMMGVFTPEDLDGPLSPSPPISKKREPSMAEKRAGVQWEVPDTILAGATRAIANLDYRWRYMPFKQHDTTYQQEKEDILRSYLETTGEAQARTDHAHYEKTQAQMYEDAKERARHEYYMRKLGQRRVPSDEVRKLVAKKDDDSVARSMLVFGRGDDVLNIRLLPHWEIPIAQKAIENAGHEVHRENTIRKRKEVLVLAETCLLVKTLKLGRLDGHPTCYTLIRKANESLTTPILIR